jgi:hypothetical protein
MPSLQNVTIALRQLSVRSFVQPPAHSEMSAMPTGNLPKRYYSCSHAASNILNSDSQRASLTTALPDPREPTEAELLNALPTTAERFVPVISAGCIRRLVPVISAGRAITLVPVISAGRARTFVPVISAGCIRRLVPVISAERAITLVPVISAGRATTFVPVISAKTGPASTKPKKRNALGCANTVIISHPLLSVIP